MEAGDPLPGNGPFVIYRGVSGRGSKRRIRGISWTSSFETAMWIAKRYGELGFEKPAVFRATVEKPSILAFTNSREENEFLCDISDDLPLIKVWPVKAKSVELGPNHNGL